MASFEFQPLRYSAGVRERYRRALTGLIGEMAQETKKMVVGGNPVDFFLERMTEKYAGLFESLSGVTTSRMLSETWKASSADLKRTFAETGTEFAIKPSQQLQRLMQDAAGESVELIKRIPQTYFTKLKESAGAGNMVDLVKELDSHGITIKNYAENVARDQTRKIYQSVNQQRMVEVGVKSFEWIHAGGANKPRPLHITRAPAGLNGGIFRFDDPPVIDENTGERGFPGQLPFCGCTMRPVVMLSDI